MASWRPTNQKLARPPSPISARSRQPHQGHHHHLQEDNSNLLGSRGAPQLPAATTSKPTTPLGFSNGQQPRRPPSRLSRQGDHDAAADYSNDTDLWGQSQQFFTGSHCDGGKRTPPDGRVSYPAYTTGAENKTSRFPGPGTYNASLKSGGPSFSMGSKSSVRKAAVERSYSPGPGTYDVSTKNSGPSFSMGPKVRLPVSQQDMNPGPGTYSDLSTSFGRGLSFSIRERFK